MSTPSIAAGVDQARDSEARQEPMPLPRDMDVPSAKPDDSEKHRVLQCACEAWLRALENDRPGMAGPGVGDIAAVSPRMAAMPFQITRRPCDGVRFFW